MDKKICSNCGSEYWLKTRHIPMRDTDTEDCSVCGEILKSWTKSTTIYVAELLLKKEKHLKASD